MISLPFFLGRGVDTTSCVSSGITVDAACVVSGKVVVTFCVTSGATVVTVCVTSGAAVAGTAVTSGSDADSVVFIISAVVVDFNKTTLSFAAVASTYTILPIPARIKSIIRLIMIRLFFQFICFSPFQLNLVKDLTSASFFDDFEVIIA